MKTLHHDNTSFRELDAFLKKLQEFPVTFFPIRHHSPACSWHLQNLIRQQKPHLIMIEGPQNYQTPPKNRYCVHTVAFFRFDYSPELVALREGDKIGTELAFIDLLFLD